MVRKFTPNGAEIKRLRNSSLKELPQKLFAGECGISERTLRRIENTNYPVTQALLQKMATKLSTGIGEIAYGPEGPTLVAERGEASARPRAPGPAAQPETIVIPRHTTSHLNPIPTAQVLYELAQGCQEVIPHVLIDAPAGLMTMIYECLTLLKAVSDRQWFREAPVPTDAHDTAEFPDISRRTRLVDLFVLLKGHDIRLVAEREIYHYPPEASPWLKGQDFCFQLVVGFAPPRGEYEEEYVVVPFDAGREVVLPSKPVF